ncbi:hypothetical protein EP7_002045 [Isosphaeraceae bacterium EP7]
MPIRNIDGIPHYYRERKAGGRIAWTYVASGPLGLAIRELDLLHSASRRDTLARIAAEKREADRRIREERDAWRAGFREMEAEADARARLLDEGLRLARAAFILVMRSRGYVSYNRSAWKRARKVPSDLEARADRDASAAAIEQACRWAPPPLPGAMPPADTALPSLEQFLASVASVNVAESLAGEATASSEGFKGRVALTCRDVEAALRCDKRGALASRSARLARRRALSAEKLLAKLAWHLGPSYAVDGGSGGAHAMSVGVSA